MTLPRKTSEVTRITGVSRNQVKTYLYRRRRQAKQMMKDCAKYLLKLPVALVDDAGKPTTTFNGSNLVFMYDHWTLKVRIKFIDAIGVEHLVIVDDLERLHSIVTDAMKFIQNTSES